MTGISPQKHGEKRDVSRSFIQRGNSKKSATDIHTKSLKPNFGLPMQDLQGFQESENGI
jgi:hypothetical protein